MRPSFFIIFLVFAGSVMIRDARAADSAPPDQIKDLTVATSTDSTLTLTWTAPGDDGMSGTASQYDLRMDTKVILAEDALRAPIVGGEPDPLPGGTRQTMLVKDLTPSTTYWFVMRAQDRLANISAFSNIAEGTTMRDTTPAVISKVKVADITPHSARITWLTDEPSTSEVRYGTSSEYGFSLMSDAFEGEHSHALLNLTPETFYYFKLKAKDQYGNSAETVNMTFETAATSTAPPTPAATSTALSQPITLKFTPRSLNLRGAAKWMTAALKLPKELRAGMKFDTLLINGRVKPTTDKNKKALQANLTKYGTLWFKVARADLALLVSPEVTSFEFSLTGHTEGGEFAVADTLKVANNISKAEWERRMEVKRKKFEQVKTALIKKLEKEIAVLRAKLEAAEKKLEDAQSSQFNY